MGESDTDDSDIQDLHIVNDPVKHLRIGSTPEFKKELQAKVNDVLIKGPLCWSPNDMDIFKHPMCLISAESIKNEKGEETEIALKIEPTVLNEISKIEWPIVVVAIVGLYRTGKSYLMNQLAEAVSSEGFALGDTIESQTKGIWAWCKIHPKKSNTVLLLIDTEGLGDIDKGDSGHDNKIFTLATLLCNCLVYNMMGVFNNDAVAKLTFVTEIAKNIKYKGKSSEDNQELNLIMPDFVLCLRDFRLKLIKNGKMISENEYLEQSLSDKSGKSEKYNKPREVIKKYFQNRRCFAFPVPGGEDVMENLERLRLCELSPKFKEVTTRFVSYIYSIQPKKLLTSKPINGQMFTTLVDCYIKSINDGAVPDVDDAFTVVSKNENAKVENEAVKRFGNQMEIKKLPVSENVLKEFYTDAQKSALRYLRENVIHDKQSRFEKEAQTKMEAIWRKIKNENQIKITETCQQKLLKAKTHFDEKISDKDYETAGGYQMFQRDVKQFKDQYENELQDFTAQEISWTWHHFVENMKKTEERILQADEGMSKQEKEDELRRKEEDYARILQKQQKEQKEEIQQKAQYMKRHYENILEDQLQQLKIEREKFEVLVMEKFDKEKEEANIILEKYRTELEEVKQVLDMERLIKEREALQVECEDMKERERERKRAWIGKRIWRAIVNE
ncbi:guanylate-binding protein 1-like [Ruditapes philippinarum]|uniref:guanylate-binding protein 1-like n=1 Tax=Ruditapes philippinarum TaxID=129788 RepID=UPI00295B79C1|nr:guanylate-binding protein 1-like [Ruditapes philippinarum]